MDDIVSKLKNSLENIKNKKSRFYFFVPNIYTPASSIYEIYYNAKIIKDLGYEVVMMKENDQQEIPNWFEKELTDLPHEITEKNQLTIKPEDFMIIPEIFTNIMNQTKDVPCKRVVFAQSYDYSLNALSPGLTWRNFGISDVIIQSDSMESRIKEVFGNIFNFYKYRIGIPDYFKKEEKPKRPIIFIYGRNSNLIQKVIKEFYLVNPHLTFVSFEDGNNVSRFEFAHKITKNFAALWIDNIATFGTFPVECMKCGTIPIGLIPDLYTEQYLKDNSGIWTNSSNQLPKLMGELVNRYLEDGIPEDIYNTMKEVSSEFTVENSKKDLEKIYSEIIEKRKKEFEEAIANSQVKPNKNKIEEKI